jgi:DNA-binding MarR family transcriptional regulator
VTRAQRPEPWAPERPGWASGPHVISAVRRLCHALDDRIDADVAGCALTAARLECLDRLALDRDAHVAALARDLGIRRQSAAALVARLRRAGLVELLTLDDRVRVPVITFEGERRRQQAHRATTATIRSIESLDVDDRAWLVDLATTLERSIQRDDRVW